MKKALGFALQISTDPVSNNCLCFGPNRHLRLIISTLVIFTFGSTKKMKEFIIWYCFCCWLQYSWECEWITCGGISSTHIERGLTSRFALVTVALTTEWQTGCIVRGGTVAMWPSVLLVNAKDKHRGRDHNTMVVYARMCFSVSLHQLKRHFSVELCSLKE